MALKLVRPQAQYARRGSASLRPGVIFCFCFILIDYFYLFSGGRGVIGPGNGNEHPWGGR